MQMIVCIFCCYRLRYLRCLQHRVDPLIKCRFTDGLNCCAPQDPYNPDPFKCQHKAVAVRQCGHNFHALL